MVFPLKTIRLCPATALRKDKLYNGRSLEKKIPKEEDDPLGIPEEEIKRFTAELYKMFEDHCLAVYIPAGRSMITLLSQQLNYIYTKMDDTQKRSLDSCTKDYLERILRVKPEFSDGLQGLLFFYFRKTLLSSAIISQALELIKLILRGRYRYSNGEDQIIFI